MKQLIILRGIPGSGKTTFANYLATLNPNVWTIAADDFFLDVDGAYRFDIQKLGMAHEWCRSSVDHHMQEGCECIVVHNTSTTEKEFQPYIDLANRHGYNVVSLVVENRHGSTNIHHVPAETLNKMEGRFHVKLT